MQSCNKTKSNGCGTGQGHEQGKDTTTIYCFMYTVTYTLLLAGDTAPQLSHKESKEKTTLIDKGVRLDLLGLYGVGLGGLKESHKTIAGYLHPRGSSMGRPATPRPHGS